MATVNDLIARTRERAEATSSNRWSPTEVLTTLVSVFEDEWSQLLQVAPMYRVQTISGLATDALGVLPLASLTTGAGNTLKRYFRIVSINDGAHMFRETDFAEVPLALVSNYQPIYPNLYYLFGETLQVLPPSQFTLNVTVNYKPPALTDLNASVDQVDFPFGAELILANVAAARLLNKGGSEANEGQNLMREANEERVQMAMEIRRRTTNPTIMRPPDHIGDWAG
jgi:hypothetical protein